MTTNLSTAQITALTSLIVGMNQNRPENKTKGISRFEAACTERFGVDGASVAEAILSQPNVEAAMEKAKGLIEGHEGVIKSREAATVFTGDNRPDQPQSKEDKMSDTETQTEDAPKTRAARKSAFTGHALFPATEENKNPRREGTHGHKSFEVIRENPGITYEDFLEKGGRLVDLKWDHDRANVRTEAPAE